MKFNLRDRLLARRYARRLGWHRPAAERAAEIRLHAAIGDDGLTDDESAELLASFRNGIGRKP